MQFIEGGWPGANPKDIEFFARAATELQLATSTLVAFGSTRRPRGKVDDDATLRNLIEAGTSAVCIVAKSSDYHVTEALQTTLDEGEAMIADSVEFLAGHGRRVLVDMEHFFDGYKAQPRVLAAGARGGGRQGRQPPRAVRHQRRVAAPRGRRRSSAPSHATSAPTSSIGIHCHDDTGCAVANSMAAVLAGAGHVQGTLNGLGERTGNANLTTIIPNLQLKLGYTCLPDGRIERLTAVSHHVAELLNRAVNPQAPYVGSSAFAHKAGLHTSAIARAKDAYEHVDPELVGNGTRFVVSEMAGRATITMKAAELGLDDGRPGRQHGDRRPQAARARGLPLRGRRRLARAADAAGRRLGAGLLPGREHARDHRRAARAATSPPRPRSRCGSASDRRACSTAEGNGPVNAIDTALRSALAAPIPQLDRVHLTDFKVRILDGAGATGAVTRVLLDATDGERDWTTIGVSANIIEASWRALEESLVYGLLHASDGGTGLIATGRRLPAAGSGSPSASPRDAERQVRGGHPWVFDRVDHVGRATTARPATSPSCSTADRRLRRHRAVRPDVADPRPHPPPRPTRRRSTTSSGAQRLGAALERRAGRWPSRARRPAYRCVHGENDGLPGLVVDRYDDTFVVKVYSGGVAAAPRRGGRRVRRARPSRRRVVLRRSRRVGVGGESTARRCSATCPTSRCCSSRTG